MTGSLNLKPDPDERCAKATERLKRRSEGSKTNRREPGRRILRTQDAAVSRVNQVDVRLSNRRRTELQS